MDEAEVRKIVQEEILEFVRLFKSEIADTPARADGNLNARDTYQTVEIVETKLKSRLVL